MALITISDIQLFQTIPVAENSKFQFLIDSTSSLIENYLNRPVEAKDYTITVYSDSELIFLVSPIVSVTEVKYADSVIPAGLWRFNADSGAFYLGFYPSKERPIEITYRGGYEVIPADIKQACIELVLYSYGRIKAGPGTRQVQIPGGSQVQILEHEMPLSVKQILSRYKVF